MRKLMFALTASILSLAAATDKASATPKVGFKKPAATSRVTGRVVAVTGGMIHLQTDRGLVTLPAQGDVFNQARGLMGRRITIATNQNQVVIAIIAILIG